MPQLDVGTFPMQLFWLALTFLVFYLVMGKVALPQVGRVIAARAARIDADLAQAASARERSETMQAEYLKALAAARAEAQTALKAAIDAVAKEGAAREAELTRRLASEAEAAEARIAAAKQAALANVRQIAIEAATAATARLAGAEPAAADVDAAVGRILQERR